MTVQDIISNVREICMRHGAKELFLFGSYAKGTQTDTSDIDFVVKGVRDLSSLEEEIDRIPTLKKIDIFDYDSCSNVWLKGAMDTYGKRIY